MLIKKFWFSRVNKASFISSIFLFWFLSKTLSLIIWWISWITSRFEYGLVFESNAALSNSLQYKWKLLTNLFIPKLIFSLTVNSINSFASICLRHFLNDLPYIPTHFAASSKLIPEANIVKPAITFGGNKLSSFVGFDVVVVITLTFAMHFVFCVSVPSAVLKIQHDIFSHNQFCDLFFQVCKVNFFYFLLDKSSLLQLQHSTNIITYSMLYSKCNSRRVIIKHI